ncbi:MAG TPA: PAS domain-containing protein, partial [Chthoniobacteraceae bacterium]
MSDALFDALHGLPGGVAAILPGLLEKVLEEVSHPVALYRRDGAMLAANLPFREMHGFTPEAELSIADASAQLFEVSTLDGRVLPVEEWPISRAARGEVVREEEFTISRVDTGSRWIGRYSAKPIPDGNGETLLIVISAENISEQKRMEEALRRSEIRTRGLVEANIIGVISADIYGNVREANDEFLRITGFTRHELTGGLVRWDQITPAEHLLKDEHAIAEAQLHGFCQPYRKDYIHRNGHRVPVLIGFALLGEERDEAIAFILDLTAQKGVEDALRQSEERYRSLVAATSSIVWTSGPTGEFVEPQEAWEAYTGQSWEEQRGTGWLAMIHESDRERLRAQWQEAVASSTRWFGAGRVWNQASQEHRHFEVRAVPIFDSATEVREWVGTVVDIHEH